MRMDKRLGRVPRPGAEWDDTVTDPQTITHTLKSGALIALLSEEARHALLASLLTAANAVLKHLTRSP
jgi:hypothetical protein